MNDAAPSHKTIAEAFFKIRPELVKRYGRSENCSLGQVRRTVGDLNIPKEILPYVYAAFLSKEDFQQILTEFPSVNWTEIRRQNAGINLGPNHTNGSGESFYESHEGFQGDPHH